VGASVGGEVIAGVGGEVIAGVGGAVADGAKSSYHKTNRAIIMMWKRKPPLFQHKKSSILGVFLLILVSNTKRHPEKFQSSQSERTRNQKAFGHCAKSNYATGHQLLVLDARCVWIVHPMTSRKRLNTNPSSPQNQRNVVGRTFRLAKIGAEARGVVERCLQRVKT
jgi:hypothetical protein